MSYSYDGENDGNYDGGTRGGVQGLVRTRGGCLLL